MDAEPILDGEKRAALSAGVFGKEVKVLLVEIGVRVEETALKADSSQPRFSLFAELLEGRYSHQIIRGCLDNVAPVPSSWALRLPGHCW